MTAIVDIELELITRGTIRFPDAVVRDELDLNALRSYFKQEHLIDAVNAGIKIGAFTALKGAAIIEQAIGRVR